MNVAIFLDDLNEFNGPRMFIPGSHKTGVTDDRLLKDDEVPLPWKDGTPPDPLQGMAKAA